MPKKTEDTTAKKGTYFYAAGKRKTSIAQVRLYPNGKGQITVNGQKAEDVFFGTLLEKIIEPLKILGMAKSYDIDAKVKGGGITGQSDAICHGIARAISLADEANKTTVKRAGLLTRDARVKERKKYGLKKARRSPQWSKR